MNLARNEKLAQNDGMTTTALNVLTLDDDKIDRIRLIRTCQKAGLSMEFYEASSIDEMRAHLAEVTFDLVFLDHNLGIDSGLDALKVLRGHEDQMSALPIMLTSIASHKLAVEAMRGGCADYVVKEELTVSGLRKSITNAVERRMLQSAMSDARDFQAKVQDLLGRFMRSSGPEMRAIVSAMLRGLRRTKMSGELDLIDDTNLRSELTMLEHGCKDVVKFLDDAYSIVDQINVELAKPQDLHRLSLH